MRHLWDALSGAIGLLWVRRGLQYWARVFELEVQRLKALLRGAVASGPSFAQECQRAYDEVMLPFHGWVARRGAAVAQQSAPEWDELRTRCVPCCTLRRACRPFRLWSCHDCSGALSSAGRAYPCLTRR